MGNFTFTSYFCPGSQGLIPVAFKVENLSIISEFDVLSNQSHSFYTIRYDPVCKHLTIYIHCCGPLSSCSFPYVTCQNIFVL
jgi:hypothetical protein